MRLPAEPFRIKVVEPVRRVSREERERLIRESGIRAVEIGSLIFGHRDSRTGRMVWPPLDLVRLAIPRHVYTTEHMRYVAESVIGLHRERERLNGLRITWEAPTLRHFTARLEELTGAESPAPASP